MDSSFLSPCDAWAVTIRDFFTFRYWAYTAGFQKVRTHVQVQDNQKSVYRIYKCKIINESKAYVYIEKRAQADMLPHLGPDVWQDQ